MSQSGVWIILHNIFGLVRDAIHSTSKKIIFPKRLTIILLTVMITVVAGPFFTLSLLSPIERLIYWGTAVPLAFFTALFVVELLTPFLRNTRSWKNVAAKTVSMAGLYTPFIFWWTNFMVTPVDGETVPFGQLLRDVLLIALAAFATLEVVLTRRAANARLVDCLADREPEPVALPDNPDTVDIPDIPRSRLLRRIDADDPGPILRLEALDHFVTVVTSAGQYHLRMRFADAIDEMDGVEGLRTHRSHWVTRAAILGTERENRRLFVHVACGARIPVSRKFLSDVEALGLG